MPWNEGSSRDPSENLLSDLVLGTIWSGVGAIAETAKLGYSYINDPQNRENIAQNAKQFAQNFGKYTPNGREWFFNDPALGFSKYRQNAETQRQQLIDARYQRSQGVNTGFDDEEDNVRDDGIRDQQEKSRRSNRYRRSAENSYNSLQSGSAPDTDALPSLPTYKQMKQQASYADNSYTPPAYTSYADLRRSLPDYQSSQYQGYQAPETSRFSDELDRPEIQALAREAETYYRQSLPQIQTLSRDADAYYRQSLPQIQALSREADAYYRQSFR